MYVSETNVKRRAKPRLQYSGPYNSSVASCECIRHEGTTRLCPQYSGPYNASVESYECVGDECRAKHCLQYISLFNASAES